MDFLFPEYRLDWFGAGPSSPNKTGALLAILLVLGGGLHSDFAGATG